MNDQPFGEDYSRQAPRVPGEPAQLEYDPYDDGLNPARGILLGLLASLALILTFCAVWAIFWS